MSETKIQIHSHQLTLLPEKALWLQEERVLIVSDIHLGKLTHFRKAGVPVPATAKNESLQKLEYLILRYLPDRLILLGDLFHSTINSEWDTAAYVFRKWHHIEKILVAGNHDVLAIEHYVKAGIRIVPDFTFDNLYFTHEPEVHVKPGAYNIAGHIHPAVRLKGAGKQKLSMPCFVFGKERGLLPAFGYFTGTHIITPEKEDEIFVIGKGKIFKMI